MRNVAILGVGQIFPSRGDSQVRLEELIFSAASSALADAGVDRDEVDAVVLAASDQLDGRAISSMVGAGPAGAFLKDEIKVTGDSLHALIAGALRVMAGQSEIVLVVSWSKTSESHRRDVARLGLEPLYHRAVGVGESSSAALIATEYRARFDPPTDLTARIVVKNREAGLLNPVVPLDETTTLQGVLESPYLAWPVRRAEVADECDGACALVIASRSRAEALDSGHAWLTGMGWAMGSYSPGERSLAEPVALSMAAHRAYKMAGISDPRRELDVAEVHDASGWHELVAYEGLRFCAPGEGRRMVDENVIGPHGELPVNPSGGALSANPVTATGLVRAGEAALQVMGRADGRQIPGARYSLAHSSSGMAAQGHSVAIFEAD